MDDESANWRRCVSWFCAINFLPQNNRLLSKSSTLQDLALLLKDGSILCYLLHFIDPYSIDLNRIENRTRGSEFAALSNAAFFLKSCELFYGLSRRDLFDRYDLLEMTNFDQVLRCLSKLSHTDKYIECRCASNLQPIPFVFVTSSPEEDAVYQHLALDTLELEDTQETENIYDQVVEYKSDKIYDDLINYTHKTAPKDGAVKRDRRSMVIQEILESEKDYLDVLETISTHYMANLSTVLPLSKFNTIFSNIEKMLSVHTNIYNDLRRLDLDSAKGDVAHANIFSSWQSNLTFYALYFVNLDDSISCLLRCEDDPKIKNLLNELRNTAPNKQCRAFNLTEVLRVPGQRILKYHLLLDNLYNSIPSENSVEKLATKKAVDDMRDLNRYINEAKRDMELRSKVIQIQQSLQEPMLKNSIDAYGRLLMDGQLKVKLQTENSLKNRHVFLFTRCVLVWNHRFDIHSKLPADAFKGRLFFCDYCVIESQPPSKFGPQALHFRERRVNSAITEGRDCVFVAKTPNAFREWRDKMCEAAEACNPDKLNLNGHQFALTDFSEAKECFACSKLLLGLFCQGFRCENCNCIVHEQCRCRTEMCAPTPAKLVGNGLQFPSTRSTSLTAYYVQAGCTVARDNRRNTLAFHTNDLIQVLDDSQTDKWHGRNVRTGEIGFFAPDLMGQTLVQHPTPEDAYLAYPWYVGTQERSVAIGNMSLCPEETFLVRKSTHVSGYALNIKYRGDVKNIRIQSTNGGARFYIAPETTFSSIPELIDYYTHNSLAPNFPACPTKLLLPFYHGVDHLKRELVTFTGSRLPYAGLGVAVKDFTPTRVGELALMCGELVKIVSKEAGGTLGFWKLETHNASGYAPLNFIREC